MITAGDILVKALSLPPDERADVAHQLLQSLPEGSEPPVVIDDELEAAIARRIENYRMGRAQTVDLATFKQTLRNAARGSASS